MIKDRNKLYLVGSTNKTVSFLGIGLIVHDIVVSWGCVGGHGERIFRIDELFADNDEVFSFRDTAGNFYTFELMTWKAWLALRTTLFVTSDHPANKQKNLKDLTHYVTKEFSNYFGK